MIYDSHIHYIPETIGRHTAFYQGVWSDKERLGEFLEKNNIAKAFLVYPSTDAHLQISQAKVKELYNQAVLELMNNNKRILSAGILDFDDLAGIGKQVKVLADAGFKVISIASSWQGKFLVEELTDLFAVAHELNLKILVHPQTINPIGFDRIKDPLLMPVLEYSMETAMFLGLLMTNGFLQKYPGLFIFSSLAGVMPFLKERFDRVYTMLRNRNLVNDLNGAPSDILKNVYVDTAGASLKNIDMAIEMFGADKIIWGSDYPVSGDMAGSLTMLDKLGAEVKTKIIAENFLRVLGEA